MLKLNLASGVTKKDGFTNVDIVALPEVDIVHDLESYPWPFETDSVDEVHCENYIEHVVGIMPFMNELYRVMKKDAKAVIVAPYWSSIRAWQDPTHARVISEASFLYYNKDWREREHLDHYPITADFDYNFGYLMYPDFENRSEEVKQFAVRHYLNSVSDIQINLTKK